MKLLLGFALLALTISAQTIEGVVRDAAGKPLAGAIISPQGTSIHSQTDSTGTYRVKLSHAGTYILHVEAPGFAATSSTAVVQVQDAKQLDFALQPLDANYSDEPNFIVAGVTDSTNHGGHGSDTVLRSTETLTNATTALGNGPDDSTDALARVREYQRAAELNPNESHYFDWGSELLAHRAVVPSIEVFTKGKRLFPLSTRMILGLAVALYTNGSDQKAAAAFYAACDLNPSDPLPYEFLAKVQSAEITDSDEYLAKLQRFAALHPENAAADYYYAAALWKHRTGPVQALLKKSIQLDPHLSPAYLLLGVTYSEQRDSANAIAAYQMADLDEAHYRLAQEYRKTGENDKADKELARYKELSKKSADQAQRDRLAIQQFVISLR